MSEICVFHLVRIGHPISDFQNFLSSYGKYPAGFDHDLVIIFKGFNNDSELKQYNELLVGVKHQPLFIPDIGFDIETYFTVSKYFNANYILFLNSYSVILDTQWLKKFHDIAKKDGVGLVGATGSYESFHLNLPESEKMHFKSFPNPHIRTNAFMLSSCILDMLDVEPIVTKMDAYKFESGTNGLTGQIIKMNLQPLVVGRNGYGYPIKEWPISNTFRSQNQENLLISDNHSASYMNSDNLTKNQLLKLTWGA
jgi:hypothetical protein